MTISNIFQTIFAEVNKMCIIGFGFRMFRASAVVRTIRKVLLGFKVYFRSCYLEKLLFWKMLLGKWQSFLTVNDLKVASSHTKNNENSPNYL